MKPGDKVYCIKNRENTFSFQIDDDYIVTKDNFYTILKIEDNHIEISSNVVLPFKYKIKEDDSIYLFPTFDEYFITNTKYRKLKLKKINENRR